MIKKEMTSFGNANSGGVLDAGQVVNYLFQGTRPKVLMRIKKDAMITFSGWVQAVMISEGRPRSIHLLTLSAF